MACSVIMLNSERQHLEWYDTGLHMGITVQLYDGNQADWDAYVATRSNSSNYHQYGWKNVVEKSFGHTGLYLAATDAQREICGILPCVQMRSRLFGNFLVSMPFFNYGGLLSDNAAISRELLQAADQLLAETASRHLELRHLNRSADIGETRQHKVSMLLELDRSDDDQWRGLDTKVRNQIRKARNSGLTTVIGKKELLEGFYKVFSRNMRDLGTPVYSRYFFQNILDTFPDTTRIISVMQRDTTVASGIMTWHRRTMEMPWASSIRDVRSFCPNNLMYWEAIRFAISTGATNFDFGRSTPDSGTFKFKKQWGASPVQLYWQYRLQEGAPLPDFSPNSPRYQMAVKIWQRLPLPVANLIGPHIVRSIP